MTDIDSAAVRFMEISRDMLKTHPNTASQCVAVCALISSELDQDEIPHSIALGSLSCNGVKAFQYKKAFPKRPKSLVDWEGHAWIDFDCGLVGEATLMRTARRFPDTSNMKSCLKSANLLDKGPFVLPRTTLLQLGLKYTKRSQLHRSIYNPLIDGLKFINDV
ncbi:hypothetical protein EDD53_2877 [Pacificibacter maritimus]|uniref:Uncharacterized protein n=1 Tax=Pacificibacter maritimus TaxID=762213 RepID=A0A3N4TZQ4_9RHOB|nr:hypothetical protein EDD53_2877 [Pacificibacter maritimus]